MQQKVIELEGGDANIVIQWGDGKALISMSHRGVAVNEEGLDQLIAALLRARGQMVKREKATLYARVPHHLKSQFLAKAQEEGLTQNAAIIAAAKRFIATAHLDPLAELRPK